MPQSPKQDLGLSHIYCELLQVNLELHNTLHDCPIKLLYYHLFPTLHFLFFLKTVSFHDLCIYGICHLAAPKDDAACYFKKNKVNSYSVCFANSSWGWQVNSAAWVFSFHAILFGIDRDWMAYDEMLETSHRGICPAPTRVIYCNRES